MKTKIFMLLAFVLGFTTANAQISSGEVSAKVIRTGNRAQKGDFGLYLGATSDIFKGIADGDVNFSAMPLINLKYMTSDKNEFRIGLEWWDKTAKTTNDGKVLSNAKSGESRFMFYPGLAHHFSNTNLLDVYVGGELPIGFGTMSSRYSSGSGDAEKNSASLFRIGVGAFVGLQAYVGNLPLAIGVEYGISTVYNHVGSGLVSEDGYVVSIADKVGDSKWKLGNQARITLSYYFKSK